VRGSGRGSVRSRGRGRGRSNMRVGSDTRGTGGVSENDRIWTTVPSNVTVESFTKVVGPQVSVSCNENIFLKFFSEDLFEQIARETNRYYNNWASTNEVSEQWETSASEIKAFVGFTILMGLTPRNDLYEYWSLSPMYHCFPIASKISRHRFMEIKRFLHFTNNDLLIPRGQAGFDKLGKVRPVLDAILKNCLEMMAPNKESAIDEAMIKYKGRSTLKQYMSKKPIKWGIKVWVRSDSRTGYVCQFHIYTGKEDDDMSTNLGERVVMKLSRSLVGGNYHLYFDNFFTSVNNKVNINFNNLEILFVRYGGIKSWCTQCQISFILRVLTPQSSKVDPQYKSYRLYVAEELISEYNSRKRYTIPNEIHEIAKTASPSKKRRVEIPSSPSPSQHFPVKGRKQRCAYCQQKGTRHDSSIRCDECDVSLCVEARHHRTYSCFKLFHTK
jgi:hypothetical protein